MNCGTCARSDRTRLARIARCAGRSRCSMLKLRALRLGAMALPSSARLGSSARSAGAAAESATYEDVSCVELQPVPRATKADRTRVIAFLADTVASFQRIVELAWTPRELREAALGNVDRPLDARGRGSCQ